MPMTRDEWLTKCLEGLAPLFRQEAGADLPAKIRVACGWPSVGALRKSRRRIGECWAPRASADGTTELFISPVLADPVEVGATLVHEVVHAVDENKHGHGAPFKCIALAVGLEGPMRATKAGKALAGRLTTLAKKLGPYPHAALDRTASPSDYKKQTTRMHKVACPKCGYTIRVTRKWLAVGLPTCTCGTPFIEIEVPHAPDV